MSDCNSEELAGCVPARIEATGNAHADLLDRVKMMSELVLVGSVEK